MLNVVSEITVSAIGLLASPMAWAAVVGFSAMAAAPRLPGGSIEKSWKRIFAFNVLWSVIFLGGGHLTLCWIWLVDAPMAVLPLAFALTLAIVGALLVDLVIYVVSVLDPPGDYSVRHLLFPANLPPMVKTKFEGHHLVRVRIAGHPRFYRMAWLARMTRALIFVVALPPVMISSQARSWPGLPTILCLLATALVLVVGILRIRRWLFPRLDDLWIYHPRGINRVMFVDQFLSNLGSYTFMWLYTAWYGTVM